MVVGGGIISCMEKWSPQPIIKKEQTASVETAEQIRSRHIKWLKGVKDKALMYGGTAIMKASGWANFLLLLKSAESAVKGNFEQSLAYVGAGALVVGTNYAMRFGIKKGASPEKKEEIREEEDRREAQKMNNRYEKEPKRVKGIVNSVRWEIVKKEGTDYETKDARKEVSRTRPDQLENFDESVVDRSVSAVMERFDEDPEAAREFLRLVSLKISYREKFEREEKIEKVG